MHTIDMQSPQIVGGASAAHPCRPAGVQAFLVEAASGGVECVGNRTECALLLMLREWGQDYRRLRADHGPSVEQVFGFCYDRKMAGTLVRRPDGSLRLYNKVGVLGGLRPSTWLAGLHSCCLAGLINHKQRRMKPCTIKLQVFVRAASDGCGDHRPADGAWPCMGWTARSQTAAMARWPHASHAATPVQPGRCWPGGAFSAAAACDPA